MLEITGLETGYGKKQVLFGASLAVGAHEIVALIGPNGAGKSTVLRAAAGLVPVWRGRISFDGVPLNNKAPWEVASVGLGFAPQGARVFEEMDVLENLEMGGHQLPRRQLRRRIEDVLGLFPALKDRTHQPAGNLSGGEQQMLALARALIPNPKLLMLDEPSLGLSPKLASGFLSTVAQMNRDMGLTVLLVEQRVRDALQMSHRVVSLKLGRVALVGSARELRDDKEALRELFL